jgi:ATP synthase protein I
MLKKPLNGLGGLRPLLAASSIGLVFVASIVIGTLIGVYLDGRFGTKPYLTLFFIFIGVAAGVKNVIYYIKKSGACEKIDDGR